ncbi:hypothetical protein HGRIS_008146 [Hohenbuehelia grisea]|uniref:CN hydrolase domain-containing protein n=1 Tax=Hohenbuehelia grisea TaxID=104357 RepID=A0ABR3J787_9AGAR
MNRLRATIFRDRKDTIFNVAALVLSFFSAGPTPHMIPLILLLALAYLNARLLRPGAAEHSVWPAFIFWQAISFGSAAAQVVPSLRALSTPGVSIAVLIAISEFTSFLALAIIYFESCTCTQFSSQWSQAAFFPAIWATIWAGFAHISPIGRLSIWSPTNGTYYYSWLLQWTGPMGVDWVVAAWAGVIAHAVSAWYMAEPQQILVDADIPSDDEEQDLPVSVWLTGLLVALALPPFFLTPTPLPYESPSTTPLQVGCILPSYHRYKDRRHDLSAFIDESKRHNGANILLWPEGAVTFRDAAEREAAFDQVREEVHGPIVGVSFEERFNDMNDPSGRTSRRRTGLALITHDNATTHLVYYKRYLVPIAESFSLVHSETPPPVYTYEYKAPKGYNKTDWAPDSPNHTRGIPLTASICLDFAAPSAFRDLASRPALILGPARTWHTSIGLGMWEQAKQRTAEVGSTLLWCDGGDGGVSGIAGQGISEVTQKGEGSWVRQVGASWPLNERITLYARIGDAGIFLFACLIVAIGTLNQHRVGATSLPGVGIHFGWIAGLFNGAVVAFQSWRRRSNRHKGREQPNESTNLLDASRHTRSRTAVAPDDCTDDFQQITQEDLTHDDLKPDGPTSDHPATSPDFTPPPSPPHSVFTRLTNLSRLSLHPSSAYKGLPAVAPKRSKSSRFTFRTSKKETEADQEFVGDLVVKFPLPPTYIPTPVESTFSSVPPIVATLPLESPTSSPAFNPFQPSQSSLSLAPTQVPIAGQRSEAFLLTPPASPTSISPSINRKSYPESLRRFKTFTASTLRASFHTPISEVSATQSSNSRKLHRVRPTSAPPLATSDVPEQQPLPLQVFIQPSPTPDPCADEPAAKPERAVSPTRYELVSPLDLTASPPQLLASESLGSSIRHSFIPPSPSWLSRNVPDLGLLEFEAALLHLGTSSESDPPVTEPTAATPLLIPPRIVISSPDSPPLSPLEISDAWIKRYSNPQPSSPLASATNSPAVSRHSSESRESAKSRQPGKESNRPEADPFWPVALLRHSGSFSRVFDASLPVNSDPASLASPISLHPHPSSSLAASAQPPSSSELRPHPEFFIPSADSSTPHAPDYLALPDHLLTLLDAVCKEAGVLISQSSRMMDYSGKRNDVVDFGGEFDYSNYQWFQDPPARRPPPSAPPSAPEGPAYAPLPSVIEQNEAFEYALGSAPNVLYARYKQYGQLGVLGWCSEFSELIDNLKELGFAGNMFVTTRARALKSCEEILGLKLDIAMQIIVMYLSSQVARLRRFLDGERQWDDYPEPQFPLEPRQYSS